MHTSRSRRWYRGLLSASGTLLAWLGRFCGPLLRRFQTPEHYQRGLAIILPGIESQSFLNHSVAWGLSDGGWTGAIEVDDWTTTFTLFFLYHLRGYRRNVRQADRIARRIAQHQQDHPGSPVYLIGHSGGGAISVLTLERLSPDRPIQGAILLAPAISRRYRLTAALQNTEHGLWNFWSPLDLFFLGIGTLVAGTLDGKHQVSAGLLGFREPHDLDHSERELYDRKLFQERHHPGMARAFNLGGHFGCTNRVFVAEYLAPILNRHD